LIRLVRSHPEWALGFEDETWWSRVAQPTLAAWTADGQPLRLVEQTVAKDDPDPKALACYGLLVRWHDAQGERREETWLRFVDGRPVSDLTTAFLTWSCGKLAAAGKTALLLVWDNASWHTSGSVRQWIAAHNHTVKEEGQGVRIVVCWLPVKSPWLNPIEPQWVHGKRKVVEPARLLTAQEVADRVCAHFGCAHDPHLAIPEQAA
jgi:transposase